MFKNIPPLKITAFFCVFLLSTFLFIIPLKIIAQGFLPIDDALRHAAKVISGHNWNEILLLSDKFKMDSHPGWHNILGLVHNLTGCNQLGLVVFPVVVLFFISSFIPLLFLSLPEVWFFTLLVTPALSTSFIRRLLFGRPYIFTITVLYCLCFLWPKLKEDKLNLRVFCLFIALICACVWIHGAWYMFLLFPACLFLSGEYRAGLRLTYATLIGTLLGAVFTGHPFIFLQQNLTQAWLVFATTPAIQRAYELRPFKNEISTIIIMLGILFWGYQRKAWNFKRINNPVFLLSVTGWLISFFCKRLWWEWGIPALCVWLAQEFQFFYQKMLGRFSLAQVALSRLIITIVLVIVVYFNLTSNQRYRWIDPVTVKFKSYGQAQYLKLLPEPGGIIYSDTMNVFYQTFFRYPQASWRYLLGFEPSWMPLEDLKTYRGILQTSFSDSAYLPWVKKIRWEDRLIINRPKNEPPRIPGLVWEYIPEEIWVGKLPRRYK